MDRRLGTINIKIFTGVLAAVAVVIAGVAVVRLDTTGKKGSGLGKEYVYDIKELAKIDPNLILSKLKVFIQIVSEDADKSFMVKI